MAFSVPLQAKLYPNFIIAHMPSEAMQGLQAAEIGSGDLNREHEDSLPSPPSAKKAKASHGRADMNKIRTEDKRMDQQPSTSADCCNLLANAPVHGDHYDYHVDADPLTFPECDWRRSFGDYCNRYAYENVRASCLSVPLA